MKFKNGDRVVVVKVESEYSKCLGHIGVIVDVDLDWEYPYEVEFEDVGLLEEQKMGRMQELFGEDEIELEGALETPILQPFPYKNERIENNFSYHAPKEGQPERYEMIREKAKELAYVIDALCPDSREKSVAMTELETVVFWANASIARN